MQGTHLSAKSIQRLFSHGGDEWGGGLRVQGVRVEGFSV